MANDKLTQAEIDSLFASIRAGGESAIEDLTYKGKKQDEYREYDFDRPSKFSVENLKSIESIMATFAKTMSQSMTARFRHPIQIEFSSIEQIPFTSEYADKWFKDYYALCITDLGHPDLHEIVIELDLAFVINMHRRYLGGAFPKKLGVRKALSEIEKMSLQKLLRNVIYENLERAFHSVTELNCKFIGVETDPSLLKITSNTDMALLVTLDCKTQEWKTTIRLCIPFLSVEGVIDRLTTENIREFQPNKKKKSYRKEIEKGLENVVEDVHVSIGELNMSLEELSTLEVGDVLRLDRKVSEPSKGYAAGVHKFDCIIGKEGIRKALRFVNFLDTEEQEKNEEIQESTDENWEGN